MASKSDGGQAFPTMSPTEYIPGMSLRDWFAGQALTGIMARTEWKLAFLPARLAYQIADAMLAAREKGE